MRHFVFMVGLLLALPILPVMAQDAGAPRRPSAETRSTGTPSTAAPVPGATTEVPQRNTLDDLFDRLGKAKDEQEAKGIASLIERRWSRSGSDTADLLMSRAGEVVEAKEYPLAIEILDRVLALEPDWAEAWYRRANVFFLLDDPMSAMADIRQVLSLEPRHFGAWAGLGHIFMSSDDKARALEAYRRALKIYPQLSIVQTLIERLKPEIDGQDL